MIYKPKVPKGTYTIYIHLLQSVAVVFLIPTSLQSRQCNAAQAQHDQRSDQPGHLRSSTRGVVHCLCLGANLTDWENKTHKTRIFWRVENCTFNSRQYKIVQYITPSNQPYLSTQTGAPDTYNLIQSSWLLFSTCSRLSKPLEIQKTCSKEPKSLPKFKINIDKPNKNKNNNNSRAKTEKAAKVASSPLFSTAVSKTLQGTSPTSDWKRSSEKSSDWRYSRFCARFAQGVVAISNSRLGMTIIRNPGMTRHDQPLHYLIKWYRHRMKVKVNASTVFVLPC